MFLSFQELESMCYESSCDILIVDYLTLLEAGESKDARYEVVGKISRSLKRMAVTRGMPVVALAQLRRPATQSRDERRPTMAELRESGNIEQDADNIILLHQPASERDEAIAKLEMIVDKNRNGSLGTVELIHNKPMCRITEHGTDVRDMDNFVSEFSDWGDYPMD